LVDIRRREARPTVLPSQRLHVLDRECPHVAAEVSRLARDGEWFNGSARMHRVKDEDAPSR